MFGIIGKKVGMTSLYDDKGCRKSCTIIESTSCVVTQLRSIDVDGYQAIQLAYDEKKIKNTSKALIGHFKKANTTPKKKVVEFRGDFSRMGAIVLGQVVRIEDVFTEGNYVHVTGMSKGKGFQGVVKRHGFSGVGGRTHGQHNRERAPGSIGASSFPSRVLKGVRMAGRTGGDRVKVENLKVMKIIGDKNLIVVSGAIPGANNSYIILER